MTQRQAQLLFAEILRHISLAKLSKERVLAHIHLEVAAALTAALAQQDERRAKVCSAYISVLRFVLCPPVSLARLPAPCREADRFLGR